MNYSETIHWMFSKLPMYQQQGKTAFKKDLSNTLVFSKYLQNPHQKFNSVHVAGTNGKGSTSHMIASVMQQAGYNVGLYTSPHLKDFRERIKYNGAPISEGEVIDFIEKNKSFLEKHQLSFFEMTVGMAFDFFAHKKVDIAIIEVGLGGRLDSTNIINPNVSVITNIGYDHTQFLGETLPEIASEKAGIIKENTPIVIGEFQKEVFKTFEQVALNKKAPLFLAEQKIIHNYKSDLLGKYQEKNTKTAVQTIRILQEKYVIDNEHIKSGLLNVVKNTGLLGRWQILQEQPKIICDTAHNKEGLSYTLQQLKKEKKENLHIVMGVVNDKDLTSILPLFPQKATYYFCKPNIPRGLSEITLKEKANLFNLKGSCYSSVQKALKKAILSANKNDVIYVGGSTFVVAEVV